MLFVFIYSSTRARLIEGLINHGYRGFIDCIEKWRAQRTELTLALLAMTAANAGAHLIVVVPETNLFDWREELALLVPILPSDRNARWLDLAWQAQAALYASQFSEAARLASDLIKLDEIDKPGRTFHPCALPPPRWRSGRGALAVRDGARRTPRLAIEIAPQLLKNNPERAPAFERETWISNRRSAPTDPGTARWSTPRSASIPGLLSSDVGGDLASDGGRGEARAAAVWGRYDRRSAQCTRATRAAARHRCRCPFHGRRPLCALAAISRVDELPLRGGDEALTQYRRKDERLLRYFRARQPALARTVLPGTHRPPPLADLSLFLRDKPFCRQGIAGQILVATIDKTMRDSLCQTSASTGDREALSRRVMLRLICFRTSTSLRTVSTQRRIRSSRNPSLRPMSQ